MSLPADHVEMFKDGRTYCVHITEVAMWQMAGYERAKETPAHKFDPPTRHTTEPRAEQKSIDIPAGWKSLPWPRKRSLAASVSNKPIRNQDDADAAIMAELERRGS